jgi:hypothetical protein
MGLASANLLGATGEGPKLPPFTVQYGFFQADCEADSTAEKAHCHLGLEPRTLPRWGSPDSVTYSLILIPDLATPQFVIGTARGKAARARGETRVNVEARVDKMKAAQAGCPGAICELSASEAKRVFDEMRTGTKLFIHISAAGMAHDIEDSLDLGDFRQALDAYQKQRVPPGSQALRRR